MKMPQNILANFGRISAQTQPIVLCFDQLDNIPRLPDGSIDLKLFNSSIHNQSLKTFSHYQHHHQTER